MGGGSSLPEFREINSNTIPNTNITTTNNDNNNVPNENEDEEIKSKNIECTERSFAMLGGVGSGKSTLANLLYGDHTYTQFTCHNDKEPFGLTKSVQTKVSGIRQNYIAVGELEQDRQQINFLKFDIIDQPGINDPNFPLKQQIEFIKRCVDESQAHMSGSFLIVIDLSDDSFEYDIYRIIMSLIANINAESYNFTENLVLVFTHKDKFMEKREIEAGAEDLEERLNTALLEMVEEEEDWELLKILLNQITKKVFVNCLDIRERNALLKKLFELTIPTLRIIFHGSTGFGHKEMKNRMKITENGFDQSFIQHRGCMLHYNFAPDIKAIRGGYTNELDPEVINGVDTMIKKLNGISVFIILVSLKKVFTDNMRNLISQLMNKYKFESKREWWKFAVCCLLVHDNVTDDTIQQYINNNAALRDICVTKAKNYYFCIKDSMTRIEIMDKILDECLSIKQENKGLEFMQKHLRDEIIGNHFKLIEAQESYVPLDYTPTFKVNVKSNSQRLELIIDDIPDQDAVYIPLSPECLDDKNGEFHQRIYEHILKEEPQFSERYLKKHNLERSIPIERYFETIKEKIILEKKQSIM